MPRKPVLKNGDGEPQDQDTAEALTAGAGWQPRGRGFDARAYRDSLLAIFSMIRDAREWDSDALTRILSQYPRDNQGFFSKIELVSGYRQLVDQGELAHDRQLFGRLQMKPIRTSSGVAPVTVLTAPAGCPGQCIFCPDAEGMPKSYLPNEPGARRAAECDFDPYRQVSSRLDTFDLMGHAVQKVELLILGGTWNAYSPTYREWFVRRCLDAMNGTDSTSLLEAQERNETARHRNVGLVIETRPDWITPAEVRHLRELGVTKVQLGVQSLDDSILALNQRGHDVGAVRRAVALLRAAGFKLHLHWMPNLLGATPDSDREDFARLWSDPGLRPDEIKIYPCSIIEGTELFRLWQAGEFRPYSDGELIGLVADCKATIPRYCRVSRVFRDIPADDIVAGSKRSNLRQLVHQRLAEQGRRCDCIRCREIRGDSLNGAELHLAVEEYGTRVGTEQFLGFEIAAGRLAGFLRLSLPTARHGDELDDCVSDVLALLPEIAGAAMIRELHVYGPALSIGADSAGEAQHLGLGRQLVAVAAERARRAGFDRLAVISAIGTRGYYRSLGFERAGHYMIARV